MNAEVRLVQEACEETAAPVEAHHDPESPRQPDPVRRPTSRRDRGGVGWDVESPGEEPRPEERDEIASDRGTDR